MSAHFTLSEFTRSDLATRARIDNSLPDDKAAEMGNTLDMMERIRAYLGNHPITITSGYRCPTLNAALKSDPSSDHVRAMAVDFTCDGFGPPLAVAAILKSDMEHANYCQIGQLIHEFGQWVHVSTRAPDKPINRIITIDHDGPRVGILEVRS